MVSKGNKGEKVKSPHKLAKDGHKQLKPVSDKGSSSEDEVDEAEENKTDRRYSLEELIADESLLKELIDRKKEDLQGQLAEKEQSRASKSVRGNQDESNSNCNNRSHLVKQPTYPSDMDRFKGGYCVESPLNTTIYASAGRILEERSKLAKGGTSSVTPQAETNWKDSSDTSYGSDDSIITPKVNCQQPVTSENNQINNFISDLDRLSSLMDRGNHMSRKDGGPPTSTDNRGRGELSVHVIRKCMAKRIEQTKQQEIDRMITEAEKGKAEIFKPPGNNFDSFNHVHNVYQIDDEFFILTAHVEESLISKIQKVDYMDLAKLLPHEKILHDDGQATDGK